MGWGVPGETAIAIAGLSRDPHKCTIFAYDAGVEMPGLVAPAKRVGLFLFRNTAHDFTPEGWSFSGLIVPYDAPSSAYENGSLCLKTMNNTNTFGFWANDDSGVIMESDTLYKINYAIRSDVEKVADSPELRIRVSDKGNNVILASDIKSESDGSDSPGIDPQDYSIWFYPMDAIAGTEMTLAFDILNFDPTDQSISSLFLDAVNVSKYLVP